MLINENELRSMCLTTPAMEELTAQVINQLKSIADPLVRYATARSLRAVFEQATVDANAAAVDHCLTNNIGLDNEHFKHEGLEFSLDYRCDYNWGDNDTDQEGDPAGYKLAVKSVQMAQKQLDAYKKRLDAAKDVIELAHPKMEPVNPKWVFKFYRKEV